jgi:hypothetical protein
MNRGRVEEERGGKETDGCPLTVGLDLYIASGCDGFVGWAMMLDEVVDMAYTVSINGIFTSIQYNGEIDQDSALLMYFS